MKFRHLLSVSILAFKGRTLAAPAATTAVGAPSNVLLDAQLGPYPVSIHQYEVKTSRPDPLAPAPELRRLLITVYRPLLDNFTCPPEYQTQIPYAPTVVLDGLAAGLQALAPSLNASGLDPLTIINCTRPVPASLPNGPLVLFSPGVYGTHDGYASTLQSTASSGYTVVAIDHTYEAAAVVFPDGSFAIATNTSINLGNDDSGLQVLQDIRVADAVSVLDALEDGVVPFLGPYTNSSAGCNETSSSASPSTPLRALMYGHSFGGSLSSNMAATDDRILGAVNLDGSFFAPITNTTLSKPLLLVQSAQNTTIELNWAPVYNDRVYGWKSWVLVNDTEHYGYTDLPLLADLLALRGNELPEILTGTIDSRRLQVILWQYVTRTFEYILKGVESDFLVGPSVDFPDVAFINHEESEKGQ